MVAETILRSVVVVLETRLGPSLFVLKTGLDLIGLNNNLQMIVYFLALVEW